MVLSNAWVALFSFGIVTKTADALPPLWVFNASAIYTIEPGDVGQSTSMCIVNRLDSGQPGVISATSVGTRPFPHCPDDGYTEQLDAMGSFIVPGFTDAHGHFISEGFRLNTPWLFDCMSVDEVVETLQAWVEDHPLNPGDWLQGQGWCVAVGLYSRHPCPLTVLPSYLCFNSLPSYLCFNFVHTSSTGISPSGVTTTRSPPKRTSMARSPTTQSTSGATTATRSG